MRYSTMMAICIRQHLNNETKLTNSVAYKKSLNQDMLKA